MIPDRPAIFVAKLESGKHSGNRKKYLKNENKKCVKTK